MNTNYPDIVLTPMIDAPNRRYFKTPIAGDSVWFFRGITFPAPGGSHRGLIRFANYLGKTFASVRRPSKGPGSGIFHEALPLRILCLVIVFIHIHGALDYFLIGSAAYCDGINLFRYDVSEKARPRLHESPHIQGDMMRSVLRWKRNYPTCCGPCILLSTRTFLFIQ